MTAESVDLPAVGNVKKEYVYGGVALVAGIGGYAWWKQRGSSGKQQLVVNGNDVIPATDRVSPTTGDSTVNVDGTAGQITTNSQWTQAAVDKLAAYGFDPIVASAALGKYLTRAGLSPVEKEAVQRAIGLFGPPPQGGPYTMIDAPTSPNTGGGTSSGAMKTPEGLHVNRDSAGGANLVWVSDAATDTYKIKVYAPSTGKSYYPASVPGTHTVVTTGAYLQITDKGIVREVTVTPSNSTGDGPSATVTFTS